MSKGGNKNVTVQENKRDKSSAEVDTIGSRLRKLRTDKGLSLSEVCEATRISETNLKALEEQNYSALPADTFTRGLLTLYARFLGEDPTPIVASFMEAKDESQTQNRRSRTKLPRNIITPKKLAEPAHVSSVTMAAILFLVIVAIFTGFCLYTSWNPFNYFLQETDNIQSIVTDIIPETQPADPADSSTFTPGPGEDTYTLTVHFLKNTGVEIRSDSEIPSSATFTSGTEKTWQGRPPLRMTFDTPESASIVVNGVPVDFPAGMNGRYTLNIPEDLPDPAVHD